MDNLDLGVHLDHQDSQACKVTLDDQVPPVNLDQLGHVVLLGHQDNLVKPVHQANRDPKEPQVLQAFQDQQVHLDNQDSEVQLEPLAVQVYTTNS